jgi:hypothetical protein
MVTGMDLFKKYLAINAYIHVLPEPVDISISLYYPGDDRITAATAH